MTILHFPEKSIFCVVLFSLAVIIWMTITFILVVLHSVTNLGYFVLYLSVFAIFETFTYLVLYFCVYLLKIINIVNI